MKKSKICYKILLFSGNRIRKVNVTLQVVKLIRNLLMLSDGYTAHVALSRADLRRTLRRELIDAGGGSGGSSWNLPSLLLPCTS